jgi:hypothetical protein
MWYSFVDPGVGGTLNCMQVIVEPVLFVKIIIGIHPTAAQAVSWLSIMENCLIGEAKSKIAPFL